MNFVNHHHAYLVIGDKRNTLAPVLELAADITGVSEMIHSDKMIWELPVWNVADSRWLKDWQATKPIKRAKCGVIVCETMTEAAGQALLKVFEEPAPGVYFFILAPRESALIETLRSRLIKLTDLSIRCLGGIKNESLAVKFFSALPVERLKQLESKIETKALIENLEQFLFLNRSKLSSQMVNEAGEIIKEVTINTDNPLFSDRLAFESLALTLPRIVL